MQSLQLPNIQRTSSRQAPSEKTPTGIKQASEILKTLNFHMNPSIHKKKMKESKYEYISFKVSKVTRNIKELVKYQFIQRNRRLMKNTSLDVRPKIQACKTVVGGTLSILKNNEQARSYLHKKYKDVIYTESADYNEKGKDKLRLQVVKWLMENRKDVIYTLNENKENILEWVQSVRGVDREEFDIIAHEIGLRKDPNLLNRLFWVFDLDSDGKIQFDEMKYSINLFREYDLSDKVNIFFELCDEKGSGYLSIDNLREFFSRNLQSQEEIRTMRFVLKDFYQELSLNEPSKGITKDELYEATVSDINIRTIVEKNTHILRGGNKKDDDISASLNNLIYSGQYEGKQGIFLPQIEGLMRAIQEKESLMQYHRSLKQITQINEDQSD